MKLQNWKNLNSKLNDKEILYQILNPGGNITALVKGCDFLAQEKKQINQILMEKYPQVEQVGFLSTKENRLEMAGGEFCLNATRCAIFEYAKDDNNPIELTVSGMNQKLTGWLTNDDRVSVKLDIMKKLSELVMAKKDLTYINIEGILIVVMEGEKAEKYIRELKENETKAKQTIKKLMQQEIVKAEKAIGVMLIEKVENELRIHPIVWVKEIDTVFYETACGSGSLGTAIYQYFVKNATRSIIKQPSGYEIEIELITKGDFIENAIVSGIVKE